MFMMCFVCNFGGFVVAHFWAQSGDEHQRILNVLRDTFLVQFHPNNAVAREGTASVGEQTHGVQEIVNDHRLKYVELKISLRAGKANSGVVSENLYGYHSDGF